MVAFDHIFATFEYEYVRTMLPIRTVAEIEKLQEVAVLFSETLIDCVKRGLIKQDDIDEFQPIVMIAIPRLAIVRGLLYKNENPIYSRHKSHMCSLFQPFHGPLHSIRKLLRSLSQHDIFTLERILANDQSVEEESISIIRATINQSKTISPKNLTVTISDGGTDSSLLIEHQQPLSSAEGCEPGQASTSNTFPNVLMDGLQYPVGRKRNSTDIDDTTTYSDNGEATNASGKDNNDDDQRYNNDLRAEASSSKANMDEEQKRSVVADQSNRSSDASLKKEKSRLDDDQSNLEVSLHLFQMQTQQLLHRLFVAISGVADQLQSNFASDLRFILKHIFSTEFSSQDEDEIDESPDVHEEDEEDDGEYSNQDYSDSNLPVEQGVEAREVNLIDFDTSCTVMDTVQPTSPLHAEDVTPRRQEHRHHRHHHHHGDHGSSSRSSRRSRGPPVWVPDQLVIQCTCCQAPFTLFRRRHHCRACGQIFCSDCSKFTKNLNCWGYHGPVRVCESCFNQP